MLEKHARRLAKHGFRIFPCEPLAKRPLTANGVYAATRSRGMIHEWWSRRPNANIGIAMGRGIFALDIDAQHGGYETLHRLEHEHGILTTDTVLAMTPSGGMHFLFRYPSDMPVGNSGGRIGRGIDTRGDGGYVVVSPSEVMNRDGEIKQYRWAHAPWEMDIAPAPRWLIKLARRKPQLREPSNADSGEDGDASNSDTVRVDGIIYRLRTASEGERNNLTFWAACRLAEIVAAGRMSAEEASALIVEAAIRTGLSEEEVTRTVKSGFNAEPRE
jgi:bifunctional DNA primase/polymerase-like protein